MSKKPVESTKKSSGNNGGRSGATRTSSNGRAARQTGKFHLEFKNVAQKLAWATYQQNDVLFLTGPAGTGKSYLAMAFAVNEILQGNKKRIIITRPIVEAGESLGFLPGTFEEKVHPYMMPLYDSIYKLVGEDNPQRELIDASIEVAPIAYMRGRSQPLDAKILTPNGYVEMGTLKVGDYVVGSDGTQTRIEGVYPQGELDIYKVKFTDGITVECSADHLWDTTTLYERRHKRGYSTKSTSQIVNSIKYGHAYNHQIPIAQSVNFTCESKLPINPYVLGALLGDGNLDNKTSITLTSIDEQIFEEVRKRLPHGLELRETIDNRQNYAKQVRIVNCEHGKNEIRQGIKSLDLLGSLSFSKFIPEMYKYASSSDRLEMLRGLLDTDGCCFEQTGKRKPRVQYYSTSEVLAKDVAFLVHSLGGTASVRERKFTEEDAHELNGRPIIHNHSCWVVSIRMQENPFRLARKANKFIPLLPLRAIISIKKNGRKQCQCIKVAARNSLYLTEHCVVTHNTFDDAICIFDEAQNANLKQLKLFLTRFGENSKVIVTGDPSQSDLGGPVALVEVMVKLESVQSVGMIKFKADSIVRNPLIAKIVERLGE